MVIRAILQGLIRRNSSRCPNHFRKPFLFAF